MGLKLGIDICDDYSQISYFDDETGTVKCISPAGTISQPRIQSVLCKKKGEDEWLIGQEAYRLALTGGGTMVDRLIKLVLKGGTATIDGTKFTSGQILRRYIKKLIELALATTGETVVDALVITVQELSATLNDALIKAAEGAGVSRAKVSIYSHCETMLYYLLSQDSNIYSNLVSVFDLRDDGLFYYEMKVVRGRKPLLVTADHDKLPEGFSLDVLSSDSGKKLADTILSACAERMLSGKLVSSVCLTGKGLASVDFCPEFIKYICNKRRVFQAESLFADGGAFAAADKLRLETAYPCLFSCEGRISSTVSVYALYGGRREQIVLAQAGANWYESKTVVDFVLDDVQTMELSVSPAASTHVETITIDLDELPKRPNKTTKIELSISFTNEKTMTVRIKDLGFGELFPSSDKVIRMDFLLP